MELAWRLPSTGDLRSDRHEAGHTAVPGWRGLLACKVPAGRLYIPMLVPVADGRAAAGSRRFVVRLQAGEINWSARRGDRVDGPARSGRQRVPHQPVRLVFVAEQMSDFVFQHRK